MANHEKHIDDLLRDALGDHTEMPPSGAWSAMEERLANADGAERIDNVLHGALGDYTEAPPATAWADMETKLDGAGQIDNILLGALGGYTEVPPAGAWADMEKRLDEKSRRRRPFAWFWYAAAVTGVLLVAYLFLDKNENNTAFRGKGTSEAIAPVPAPQTVNSTNNETITPTAEEAVTEKVTTPETAHKEEKKGVAHKEEKKETANPAPQHKQAQEQKTAPVVKDQTPAQKIQDTPKEGSKVAQQIPATNIGIETVAPQEDSARQKDDIAAAMSRRGPGTVMNVVKSRYADSMEQVEKDLAKLQEEQAAVDTTVALPPVIAAVPDTILEVAREEQAIQADTINTIAKDAIDKTEENLVVKQDAIPGSEINVPVDKIEFEEPDTIANINTQTADPEKGSLIAFIGPMQDTASYVSAFTSDELLPENFVNASKPVQLDFFMKLGMERGLAKSTANKFVLAPMLQARLSDRFSLVFQPAFKIGNTNLAGVGKDQSYNNIKSSYMDSIKSFTVESNAQGIISQYINATYYYQESYDSIVISRNLSSTRVMEADLPLMLNYKVTKQLSVYGGPVVSYSNMLLIDEKLSRYDAETRRDTISYFVPLNSAVPSATPIREVFPFSGRDSSYQLAPYNPSANKVRLGYMLGISYNYKRFSADLSVQQNLSRLDYIPNAAVRSIYLQPYTRFMIGYQLNNRKK